MLCQEIKQRVIKEDIQDQTLASVYKCAHTQTHSTYACTLHMCTHTEKGKTVMAQDLIIDAEVKQLFSACFIFIVCLFSSSVSLVPCQQIKHWESKGHSSDYLWDSARPQRLRRWGNETIGHPWWYIHIANSVLRSSQVKDQSDYIVRPSQINK